MDTNVETVEAQPAPPAEATASPAPAALKPFRQSGFLAEAAMRKLRARHEEFVRSLVARLSTYLRMDFGMELAGFTTVSFQKFIERMVTPTHLTLFRAEPLRGVGVLEIPPKLGLAIVDRLLGGAGQAPNAERALTEIETALLDQVADLLLNEWCRQWHDLQPLKHALLGHEIDGRFLNTTARDTLMLEMLLKMQFGECQEACRIGLPYGSLEPVIRQLNAEQASATAEAVSVAVPAPRWNLALDDVPVAISAELGGLQLTARALANLKVGDTLPLHPQQLNQIRVRLARTPKFIGALGTTDGLWAVKLTHKLEN